jgi:hypothetical protein
VLRVEYQTRVGAPLGWLELYRQPVAAGDAPGAPTTPGQPGAAPGAPGQPSVAPTGPGPEAADQDRGPAYLMRTEVSRVLAGVSRNIATRIAEDIDQIFGQ